jgi:hypothetical protein
MGQSQYERHRYSRQSRLVFCQSDRTSTDGLVQAVQGPSVGFGHRAAMLGLDDEAADEGALYVPCESFQIVRRTVKASTKNCR